MTGVLSTSRAEVSEAAAAFPLWPRGRKLTDAPELLLAGLGRPTDCLHD